MAQVLVGTTSWTDKTLIACGRFYPPQAKSAEDRLRYYATRFPIVEVDSSYYALPSVHNAELWTQRTPAEFVFNVKAFRLFTQHQTSPQALPADLRRALGAQQSRHLYYRDLPEELRAEIWKRFRDAVAPLARAGKLGVVLLQFAPWFVYGKEALDYVALCVEKLEGLRVALELRNESWFGPHTEDVLTFERNHALIHVIVDEPQGTSASVPAVWKVTTPAIAVVRLHGRNAATWQKKGITVAERFNYLYSGEELTALGSRIQTLATRAREVHVLFNNCYEDNAQRNAAELRSVLSASEVQQPPS
jgi:uncharacterized protein YecE (DUF72 family)